MKVKKYDVNLHRVFHGIRFYLNESVRDESTHSPFIKLSDILYENHTYSSMRLMARPSTPILQKA